MSLQQEISAASPKEVINNNELFSQWVSENLTLDDVLRRCPDVIISIFEAYNNDWCEVVENECAEMGLDLGDDFEIVTADQWDEDEDDEYGDE